MRYQARIAPLEKDGEFASQGKPSVCPDFPVFPKHPKTQLLKNGTWGTRLDSRARPA
jgi:hypothetical protein